MKKKLWQKILIAILIIVLFTCIGLTNQNRRSVTVAETVIGNIITIPQRGFSYLKSKIVGDEQFFSDIDKLKEKNEELIKENETLKNKMLDYEVLESENSVLKEHARIDDTYHNYEVVSAEIILDAVSNWEEVYVINKGSNSGIKPNMAVITGEGLVGYVSSVSDNTAKVVSILDAGNAVSARIVKTRDAVICKGSVSLKDKQELKLEYIPIGLELIEGDKIETSGMGGIYPKGIAIGEVKSFTLKKNPTENEAIIETYVDFNKLETVAVIINEK